MAEFKQDMPPPGGYAPIIYKRIPLKKGFFNAKVKLLCCVGIMAGGWVSYHINKEKEMRERIEMRCAKLALLPMIEAEADRALLKQLRKNRELEEKIMKDVEGWEVGKWKHAPVYLTLGPDDYFLPHYKELYAHTPRDTVFRTVTLLEQY